MTARIMIKDVLTRRDRRLFVELPWRLYRGDPNWVPPLLMDMYNTLNPARNALLRLGPNRFFLAERNGQAVGRLGVGADLRLNKAKNKKLSYFTLFECIQDYQVAEALFDAGRSWLKAEGFEELTGPQSPSNGDDYRGLLIEGFDSPPVLLESYNPGYYQDFIERYGFEKNFDRHAYFYQVDTFPEERMEKGVRAAQERYGFTIRHVNLKEVERELILIKKIVDLSMPDWPDMIPPSMDELRAEYLKLKPVAAADLVLMAHDSEGNPIGLSVALPDYNQVLIHLNGRLFPTGWLKFLWLKKKISGVRVFALFVVPAWRKKAVSSALYYHTMLNARRLGYQWGEGSTIHEFNTSMNREARKVGGDLYKLYRIYTMKL